MIYPGIDLVYLPSALRKSKSDNARFREIVFQPDEYSIIDQADDPELMIHILWAAKEAVYKSYVRNENLFAFMPRQIQISTPRIIPGESRSLKGVDDPCELVYQCSGILKNRKLPVNIFIFNDMVVASVLGIETIEIISSAGLSKSAVRTMLSERNDQLQSIQPMLISYSHDGDYAGISYVTMTSDHYARSRQTALGLRIKA